MAFVCIVLLVEPFITQNKTDFQKTNYNQKTDLKQETDNKQFKIIPKRKLFHNQVTAQKQVIFDYTRTCIAFFKKHNLVFHYSMLGVFLAACIDYVEEFWQLLIRNIGIPVTLFGTVSIGFSLSLIPGNLLAYKVKKHVKYKQIFTIMPFLYGIGFIGICYVKNVLILIPLFIITLLHGIMEPLLEDYLHSNITNSKIRASIDSFVSLGMRGMTLLVGIVFSIFANKVIRYGYLALGILCFAYVVWNKFKSRLLHHRLDA